MEITNRQGIIESLRTRAGIVVKQLYTKDELRGIVRLICNLGWIPNLRPGNVGGVGNTVEDLLGIRENNLPVPNSGEWELKCQRINVGKSSLTTLLHQEPSPQALFFVTRVFLPYYGWPHRNAGIDGRAVDEISFRQTISAKRRSSRGFMVQVDREQMMIKVSFDPDSVSPKLQGWKESVALRVGTLGELNPQPYWGFKDLESLLRAKLTNCVYMKAKSRITSGGEELSYFEAHMLRDFSFDRFLEALESGIAYVDFDASGSHNHGTKIRLKRGMLNSLYDYDEKIV